MSAYYLMSSVTGDYKRPHAKLALTQPRARVRTTSAQTQPCGKGKSTSFGAESFPQKGDEFSTCGKGLLMKLPHGTKSPKIGRNVRKKFFGEMS
jgi:hypothetical protein